jgi:uncharacterized protein (DUF2147 family)
MRLFALSIFLVVTGFLHAQSKSIIGTWISIDDETGKPKSHVKIYLAKNGSYYGKIIKLIGKPQDAKCIECKGKLHNKPVVGLVIIKSLEKDGTEYEDGTIMDPENGKTYNCKIWIDSKGKLKVRGYIGFLYRTQTWKRLK